MSEVQTNKKIYTFKSMKHYCKKENKLSIFVINRNKN